LTGERVERRLAADIAGFSRLMGRDSGPPETLLIRPSPNIAVALDTTFVKPAALGPLTATARLVQQDERSAFAEAELLDSSGQVVARARAELRVRERRK